MDQQLAAFRSRSHFVTLRFRDGALFEVRETAGVGHRTEEREVRVTEAAEALALHLSSTSGVTLALTFAVRALAESVRTLETERPVSPAAPPTVAAPTPPAPESLTIQRGTTIREAEWLLIVATLGWFSGELGRVATVLGVSRRTLYNKLRTEVNMDTEKPTTSPIEQEPTTNQEASEGALKPKLHRGFRAMSTETQRRIASLGGKTVHLNGKLYKFTSAKASEAGKKGGAKTSANREHMASIGQKGGFAKRGWRAKEEPREPESSPESPAALSES